MRVQWACCFSTILFRHRYTQTFLISGDVCACLCFTLCGSLVSVCLCMYVLSVFFLYCISVFMFSFGVFGPHADKGLAACLCSSDISSLMEFARPLPPPLWLPPSPHHLPFPTPHRLPPARLSASLLWSLLLTFTHPSSFYSFLFLPLLSFSLFLSLLFSCSVTFSNF